MLASARAGDAMKGIKGFRLRRRERPKTTVGVPRLPEPAFDRAARDSVWSKVQAMGEEFFSMSEDTYGDWLNALPRDEFIEFLALILDLEEKGRTAPSVSTAVRWRGERHFGA